MNKKIILIPLLTSLLVACNNTNTNTSLNTNTNSISNSENTEFADVKPENTPEIPREYISALKKAQSYSENMHMSKLALFEQLTSEYGEKFPVEAAEYAVDNVIADYNLNALEKAKLYQETMDMST